MPPPPNGWNSWGKHVLAQLEQNTKDHADIHAQLVKVQVEIATLKVKSGVWGAAGAAIPVIIGLGIWALKS
jgi:hypothetical protein